MDTAREPRASRGLALALPLLVAALLAVPPSGAAAPAPTATLGTDVVAPAAPSVYWNLLGAPPSVVNRTNASAVGAYLPSPADLLFGGSGQCGTYCGDTYAYLDIAGSFQEWTTMGSRLSPSPREGAASVFVPQGNYTLLFGGFNGSYLNDTWIFTTASGWLPVPGLVHPTAREGASLAWDPTLQAVVLFGGEGPGGLLGDTWTFAHDAWAPLAAAGPPAREGASLGFAQADGRLWLFGGWGSTGYLNDTWGFNGAVWYRWETPEAPSARSDAATTVTTGGHLLLFGGHGAAGWRNDTWAFADGSWAPVLPEDIAPPPCAGASLVPDLALGSDFFLLVGGAGPAGTEAQEWDAYFPQGGVANGSAPLSVELTASPRSGSAPLPVQLMVSVHGGLLPEAFHWSLGNGVDSSEEGSLTYTYAHAGTYLVVLHVTDAVGDQAQASVAITVTQYQPPPWNPLTAAGGPPVWLAAGGVAYVSYFTGRSALFRSRVRRSFYQGTGYPAPPSRLHRLGLLLAGAPADPSLGRLGREAWAILGLPPVHVTRGTRWRWPPLVTYTLRRVLLVIPQLLAGITLIYTLATFVPNYLFVNPRGTSAGQVASNYLTGLEQFTGNILTGHWGMVANYASGEALVPVGQYIGWYLPYSVELAAIALTLSLLLAYPLGLLAGWRQRRATDAVVRGISTLGLFFSTLVVALLILGFVYEPFLQATGDAPLGSLPSTTWFDTFQGGVPNWVGYYLQTYPTGFPLVDAGLNGDWSAEAVIAGKVLLQAGVIALVYAGIFLRYGRLLTANAAREPHIHAARARGISDRSALWRHTGRQVLPGYVYVLGNTFGLYIFVQLVVEWALGATGMGFMLIQGLESTSGINTFGSGALPSLAEVILFLLLVSVLAVNIVCEVVGRALDPRISQPRGK